MTTSKNHCETEIPVEKWLQNRLSETEVNAEKARKSRPDLIPATALRMLSFNPGSGDISVAYTWVTGPDLPDPYMVAGCLDQINSRLGFTNMGAFALAVGKVMAYGRAKHGHCTWRIPGTEQADPRCHLASLCRHLCEYMEDPDAVEEGSGYPVLLHAATQALIVLDLMFDPPGKLEHA